MMPRLALVEDDYGEDQTIDIWQRDLVRLNTMSRSAGVAREHSHHLRRLSRVMCSAARLDNYRSIIFAGQLVWTFSLDVDTRGVHFLSALVSWPGGG